jgi:hypothetical protein
VLLEASNGVTAEVLEWFNRKGITADTIADFGITVESDGAVCFPYGSTGVKRRYGVPSGDRTFKWAKGVSPSLFNQRDLCKPNLFLVEGETDTMRLRQAVGDNPEVGVIGLPGIETWTDEMGAVLNEAQQVWVILDNDTDYNVVGRVDNAWRQIRNVLGTKARRVKLPRHINDVCDFFEDYDLDALRMLVDRKPSLGQSRFKVLDLTAEPPPVKWLVDGMICHGDIHLLIGEPGIGKSWLTMALALAIAGGSDTFLGRHVSEHGRVLYLDEENPEDLVYSRLTKLGLNEATAKNIRYISNEGVNFAKHGDEIIEEAFDFEPELTIIDSLTRFHNEDENNAGSMAGLFNDAIKPLARQTGSAVVLIHHVNKTDSTSSYKRSRGSGDIPASIDSGYDVREVDSGVLAIANFKSRRSAQGDTIYISIKDTPDGRVELTEGQHIPF